MGAHRQTVVRTETPDGDEVWLAVSYQAVRQVTSDPAFSRAQTYGSPVSWLNAAVSPDNMLSLDGGEHKRVRIALSKAMDLATTERLRESFRKIIHRQLDLLAETSRPVDFVAAFAGPVAAFTVADLLGAPDPDPDRLLYWSGVLMSIDAVVKEETDRAERDLLRYAARAVATRRRHPDDRVISNLIRDDTLTRDDVFQLTYTTLGGGLDNLTTMLGYCMLELHAVPDRQRVLSDPDVLATAVEEILRFRPVGWSLFPRVALHDVKVDGVVVPRGATVIPVFRSGNHDGRQFDRPGDLDLSRKAGQHLSFGRGRHYCAGAPMSKIVLQEAAVAVFQRLPSIRPVDGFVVEPRVGRVADGFARLPVTW
ncbi:MAG: cytochrome P450 [Gaiellaceae bacterium]